MKTSAANKSPNAKQKSNELRVNERKWGKPLIDAGWTAIPSVILKGQRSLGLSAVDLVILLQIAQYWWTAENLPYPGPKTIAKFMGLHARYVRRRLSAMEGAGLIERVRRKSPERGDLTSSYDFSGLIKKATPMAANELKNIKDKKEKRDARARKTPLLRIAGS